LKVAVSSQGEGIDSGVSPVFGRCPFFVIVEVSEGEIKEVKSLANQAMSQAGGAGIMAAQNIGNEGADAIISGATGPRAFGVLQQLGIEVYQNVGGTVKENAEKLSKGELQKISQPGPMGIGPGKGAGMGAGQGRGAGRGAGQGMGAGRGRR